MPYCPECSASVPSGAAVCPTCGASLVSTPADAAEPSAPPTSDLELVTADLRNSVRPQYELLRVLGTGGMGTVFLLREPALKRLVAVKVLAPWLAADPTARARFAREARAAAALSHPNVVRVYAEGETLGLRLPYIVMQYVEGPTLAEWMEQHKRASEREARRIIGEVAAALAAAHARQLVHRDVKPSNVLVEHETGRAYVVDFGVSAALATAGEETTRLTATGTVAGTPIYMSPEQALGEAVTPKSDVYSLGVLAYELLVGQLPYEAHTAMGWAAAHLHNTPTPVRVHRADLAPEVAALVDRCLAKSADDRPTAVEVARGLLPSIESEIEWPPPGLHWMRGRGSVLGRIGVGVAGGALLTLTALLLTPPILQAHSNWLWRFQVERAASTTDPSSVPLFVWQTTLALGLALFTLGTVAFLGVGTKLLARAVRLRRAGWRWGTLLDLAADRDGRSGSILAGAREFASLEAPARASILRARRRSAGWRTAAGLWTAAGLGLWAVALAAAAPSDSRAAPVVTLTAWLLLAVPPLGALAVSVLARARERILSGPLARSRGGVDADTDATRWYRGFPGGAEPAAAPRHAAPRLARAAEIAALALGVAAVIAVAESAVAGVAAVIFTQRLGPKTVAFIADQARLSSDDPMRVAQLAVRPFLPPDEPDPPAGAPEGWMRGLRGRPGATGGLPAYPVEPSVLIPHPDVILRDVVEGRRKIPADTLEMLEALGANTRTMFFRRLARFGALDSLFTPRRYRTGRAAAGSTDLEPVRTPLGDAALANVAGAIAAAARHRLDSAAVRLGENAALAEALLRVPQPRVNQIAAHLLASTALAPLSAIAAARGDAAGAAQLADAAQRMASAIPYASGVAGLAVDPKDLIQFTGAVLSARVPAGYRVEWLAEGWAGLCANPWELLAGPSAARAHAIVATADLAVDVPHARDLALSAGGQWSAQRSEGANRVLAWVRDRSPWGLVSRIRECGGVI